MMESAATCSYILLSMSLFIRSEARPPNVVFILADDYGYNDVGYHGSQFSTPHLDKLAAQGVKLENYYVQPICTPSRSQLMTGRYQIHTGLQHQNIYISQPNSIPLDTPTLAEEMRKLGYKTHGIGKWHLGFYKDAVTPTHRGFDTFFGYFYGREGYYNHSVCADLFKNADNEFDSRSEVNGRLVCGLDFHDGILNQWNYSGLYSTHLFTQKALDIFKDHQIHNADSPLFLYLPYQAVHIPLEVPDKYSKPYSNIDDLKRRTLGGMVSAMDEAVGNLTDGLKEAGLYDNTVIVFSTDNGGEPIQGAGNNWPLRGWKDSLWEGGMKGVGFVHSPLLRHTGYTSHQLMHISDWFPTITGLGGANTTSLTTELQLDGFDQWRTITNPGSAGPRKEILHNIDPLFAHVGKKLYNNTFDNRVRAALRVGDWKIVTGKAGRSEWVPPQKNGVHYPQFISIPESKDKNLWLFDLSKDPEEKHDLSETHADVVKQMLETLQGYNKTAVPCRCPPFSGAADPNKHGGAWQPWE